MKHDGVPVADCLSCNVQADSSLEDETINVTIAAISMFQEGKINQIKCETSKDLTLVKLAKVVQTGWPDQRAEIDPDHHAFWIHRWNLSIVDGVIMNGTCIVIPKALQDEYLKCPCWSLWDLQVFGKSKINCILAWHKQGHHQSYWLL